MTRGCVWLPLRACLIVTGCTVIVAIPDVPTSTSQCLSVVNGMIIGALNYRSVPESTSAECCAQCNQDDQCLAWTWESETGVCYLKDDIFYRYLSDTAVSGLSGRPSPYGNGSIARACSTENTSSFPFCDSSLSIQSRVNDLISRLTLDEKAAMLTARQSPAGDVPRLGVPEYDWGANCIHGVQSRCALPDSNGVVRCPTSFPNPIGLGAAFNRTLWQQMGYVIGLELRALWLQGVGENHLNNLPHLGLDCWSPNINIARDPRWGRILETTGEDPMLTGEFGSAYSDGLQNNPDEDRYLQGVTTLKHFAAYSLESYEGVTRHTYNAVVSNYDAATTYFPSWRTSTGGVKGARGVMCSYNEVNGVPSCANDWLLQRVLRGDVSSGGFGFDGYITSDSGAVEDIYNPEAHGYVSSGEEGIALAINATCDVDSSLDNGSDDTGSPYTWNMNASVEEGYLQVSSVDAALNRSLWMRFALGLFDDIEDQPLWNVSPEVVHSQSHVQLNMEATRQSLVLLRNDDTLPITTGKVIAVIGPHANATEALTGNYLGQLCPEGYQDFSCIQTPFEAINLSNANGSTRMALGCDVECEDDSNFSEALALAQSADFVLLMMGIDTSTVEAEGKDRETIALPGKQQELVTQILALNKPSAVVLIHGGALGVDFLYENSPSAAPAAGGLAVISAFYPGPQGAQAIADALFGVYSPSGRLPYTMFGADYINEADFLSMDLPSQGMTYKYYSGSNSLWPFAYGLGYASFSYTLESSLDPIIFDAIEESFSVSFNLNISRQDNLDIDAKIIFTVMVQPLEVDGLESNSVAKRQLVNFLSEVVSSGDYVLASISVSADDFKLADDTGDLSVWPGTFNIEIWEGSGSPVVYPVTISGSSPRLVTPFPV